MNLIAQAIIAYLGLLPPLYALLDLFILQDIKTEILLDFMVYYTLIIFTFVGAINWKISDSGSLVLTLYGAIPSLISFLIVIGVLMDFSYFQISLYLVISLILQLFFDFIIYLRGVTPKFYISYIRIPVTIVLCLFLIIPNYIYK